MKWRWIISVLVVLATCFQAKAQTDPTYRMEIGAGAGVTNYIGDFNGNIDKNFQPAFSILFRRNFSPWHGIRIDAQMTKLKGSSADQKDFLLDYYSVQYDFKRTMYDFNIVYEYNFWPFGTGNDYRGAKRLVPFVFIGFGGTVASGNGSTVTGNMPVGIGIKYKVSERMNIGIDWGMHFSLSDKLDNVSDPKYIKSSGIFKNADGYSSLRFSLTYSFSAKCPTCNKYE